MAVIDEINSYMLSILPNNSATCSDSISKTHTNIIELEELYDTEFLNTINCSGIPPYINFT